MCTVFYNLGSKSKNNRKVSLELEDRVNFTNNNNENNSHKGLKFDKRLQEI